MNLEGEMTKMLPLRLLPEMVPLPFVTGGSEDMEEYVAVAATPKRAPLGAPMSSVPVRVPVGLAPSAVNTPEKIVW